MAEETQVPDFVYSLATSPNFAQDGICFAARASGLYRSDDGSLTWQNAYASLELDIPLTTAAVAVSPNFVPGGILRSGDGGQKWYIASLPSPPPFVSTLVVSPNFTHDGTLLAGTLEDGVFRSADRGSHWSPWNFGLLDLNVLSMAISPDFAHDEALFVGSGSGIFRSTNGGRAWREVNFPTDFAPVLSLAPSPDYAHDGTLFAGTESCGLFYSGDRGHTWTRLGKGAVTEAVNAVILSPQFPDKPDILVLLGEALLISRDGGHSWADWQADLSIEQGMVSVAAPQGLDPEAPLLVGLVEGGVRRL
jgi:photosystem II stability/assembly factor-like uncharacterized protein